MKYILIIFTIIMLAACSSSSVGYATVKSTQQSCLAPWLEKEADADFLTNSAATDWIIPAITNAISPEKIININAADFYQAQEMLSGINWENAKNALLKITYRERSATVFILLAATPENIMELFYTFSTHESWEEKDNFKFMAVFYIPENTTQAIESDQIFIAPAYRSKQLGVAQTGRDSMKLILNNLANNGFAGRNITAYCVNPKVLEYLRSFCNAEVSFSNLFEYPIIANRWISFLKHENLIPSYSPLDPMVLKFTQTSTNQDHRPTLDQLDNTLKTLLIKHAATSKYDGKHFLDYVLKTLKSEPDAFSMYDEYTDKSYFQGLTVKGTLRPPLNTTNLLPLEQAC